MPRKLLLLVLAIFPLIAGTACFGQESSKKERPVPTFEDSVRAELVNSRNNYQAVAGHLEHEVNFGAVIAGANALGIGSALYFGWGAAYAVAPVPGLLMGAWMAFSAMEQRKVMQGWDQSPKKTRATHDRTD